MKQYLYIIALLAISFHAVSQTGCTDENANNYDPNAQENDGSCTYEPMVLDPIILIDELPSLIEETSGLIYFKNGLWTHNDSGGQAAIYKIDPSTGEVIQTISISNGTNVDIEDITQDLEYIYVGDFGNNHGTRDDLRIYKLKKSDIPETENASINAEIIEFSYKDQVLFERKNRNNDFDCEAITTLGDHLYIFTKNWVDHQTKCYKIPKTPGEYELEISNTFNARGLITSADYNVERNTLLLLGYENFVPFMWVIWDFNDDDFCSGYKKRVDFAYISGAQTEGVCFIDRENIIISSEDSYFPPRLYKMQVEQVIAANQEVEKYKPFQIKLRPNPAKGIVNISIDGLKKSKFDLEVYNLRWQKVSQYSFIENNYTQSVNIHIPTSDLGKGIFFVRIKEGKNIGFKKLILN